MLLLNIEYVPGKEVEALGLVKGAVVQSKNFGRDLMAGMKTLVGGEIVSYTEMLNEARQIAMKRMVEEAEALGADIGLGTAAVWRGGGEIIASAPGGRYTEISGFKRGGAAGERAPPSFCEMGTAGGDTDRPARSGRPE